jgi:hypothetical protein
MFLFSWKMFQHKILHAPLVSSVLLAGIYSLIITRDHYKVVTHTGYEDVFMLTAETHQQHPGTLSFISAIDHIEERTKNLCSLEKFNDYHLIHEKTSLKEFRSLIAAAETNYVTFAWTTQYFIPRMEMLSIIHEYYPILQKFSGYAEAEFYLFSKNGDTIQTPGTKIPVSYTSIMDPAITRIDQYGDTTFRYAGQEFGVGLELSDASEHIDHGELISFRVKLDEFKTVPDIHLALSVEQGDSVVFWKSTRGNETISQGDTVGYVYNTVRLSDLKKYGDKLVISASVWNPNKNNFTVREIDCVLLPGNYNLYGHLLPITQ